MTTTGTEHLSPGGGRPQGAFAADVGSGRTARAIDRELSTGSESGGATPPQTRFLDTTAFHLVRLFGLTLAAQVVAGLIGLIALRIATDGEPDPWSTIQLIVAEALLRGAEIFGGFLAAMGGLGLVLLGLVVGWLALHSRTRPPPGIRTRPDPTTAGRERQ